MVQGQQGSHRVIRSDIPSPPKADGRSQIHRVEGLLRSMVRIGPFDRFTSGRQGESPRPLGLLAVSRSRCPCSPDHTDVDVDKGPRKARTARCAPSQEIPGPSGEGNWGRTGDRRGRHKTVLFPRNANRCNHSACGAARADALGFEIKIEQPARVLGTL